MLMSIPQSMQSIRYSLTPYNPPFPVKPTEENIPKLKSWLLNQFSKLDFEITLQPLQSMSGKPPKLYIVDDAIPYVARKTKKTT